MVIEVSGFAGFNRAADNNRVPIGEQLSRLIPGGASVLEIGSGSGQHAALFADGLPEVTWQPTDRGDYFSLLESNLASVTLANLKSPLYLDVSSFPDLGRFDAIFSANVLHIMSASLIEPLMAGAAASLKPGGLLLFYGPFKYRGEFTTASNAAFDQWLKERDAASGIRDIEAVEKCAEQHHFTLIEDVTMPANNQLLVFNRS